MKRTNIVLDDKLVTKLMKTTQITTKRELVDFALHELLRHSQQSKILDLKGKVKWEGDLTKSREGRRL